MMMVEFIGIIAGFFLLVIFLKVLFSGFGECTKCGCRLTILEECTTPDHSYGWEIPHQHVERYCIHCGHAEVVIGSVS